MRPAGNATLEDITLDACEFDNVADGNIIKHLRGVRFRGLKINGKLVPSPR